MFIQHLATTTHNVVKTERKPRRNIQYRDVATAVAKTDNLEFLVDVVPKTTTYKEFKKRQEEKSALREKEKGKARGNGQMTLGAGGIAIVANGSLAKTDEPDANGHAKGDVDEEVEEVEDTEANEVEDTSEAMEVDEEVEEQERASSEPSEDMAAKQIEMEMRGPRTNGSSPEVRRPSGFTAINGTK